MIGRTNAQQAAAAAAAGGPFDLVKVTAYTPEVTRITGFTLSGITTLGYEWTDYSEANGSYAVTPETASLSGTARIYKHAAKNYWFKWAGDEYDGYAWCFTNNLNISSTWSALLFCTDENAISAGTAANKWQNFDSGWAAVTFSNVTTGTVPMVLTGVKAAGYSGGVWTWDGETFDLTGFDCEPGVGLIYLAQGTSLKKAPVDSIGQAGRVFTAAGEIIADGWTKTNDGWAVGGFYKEGNQEWYYPIMLSRVSEEATLLSGVNSRGRYLYSYKGMLFVWNCITSCMEHSSSSYSAKMFNLGNPSSGNNQYETAVKVVGTLLDMYFAGL